MTLVHRASWLSVLTACGMALGSGIAGAQTPSTAYFAVTDLAIPAGAATLQIRRELLIPNVAGTLGNRWILKLEGFGDPIVLDGRPAARQVAERAGFKDVLDVRTRLASRTDRYGNTLSLSYDRSGRLARVTGPKGVVIAFVSDPTGKITTIRAARGDVAYAYAGQDLTAVQINGGPALKYTYRQAPGPIRIEDPASGRVDVSYDGRGRVTSYRFADGATERFEYEDLAGIERQIDPLGGTTVIRRSDITESTDAAGHTWTSTYDPVRRTISETGPTGAVTRTTLDTAERVVAVVDAAGHRTTYEYDPVSGLTTAVVHPDGARQTFEYDAAGALTTERLAGQLVRAFSYNPDGTIRTAVAAGRPERRFTYTAEGRVKSVSNALNEVTVFEYDARGNVVRETNPLGGVTLRAYDAHNRVTSETDPTGAVTRWRYDDRSRLAEAIDALGASRRFEYDSRGRLSAETDATGQSSRYQYDAAGRVTQIARPGGRFESFTYDATGNLTRSRDDRGRETTFQYDPLGRAVVQKLPSGLEVRYAYSPAGHLVSQTESTGETTVFAVDSVGRLVRVTTPTASAFRYQYDPSGRLTTSVDPIGHVRTASYAPDGALISARDATNQEAQYTYDAAGRLTSVRRASGGILRFEYDALGNLVSAVDPLGTARKYGHDRAGRTTAITDETGGVSTLAYDKAGRLTERQLPDGATITLRYDGLGRVIEAANGPSPVRLTYDSAGNVVATEYSATGKTVRSVFDAQGLRTALVDADGRETRYEYDAAKQITAIHLPDGSRVIYTYDPRGRPLTIAYPNGVLGTWRYDAEGRIAQITYVGPNKQPLDSIAYTFNQAGNVIERRDLAGTTRLDYDPAGQLIEESSARFTTRYRYSPGGNRASMERDGQTTTYQYDANDRLTRAESGLAGPASRSGATPTRTAEDFTWDARGTLQRRTGGTGATAYAFDPLQRLTNVTTPDGTEVSYAYAATGERISRRDRAGLVHFLYDDFDLIQEVDDRGQTRAAYVHSPDIDRPVAMIKNGQTYFFHADRYGSILFVTDSAGRAVSTYEYDAFGNYRSRNERVTSPFGFSGREFDAATGLYYFRARYYDPALGRFLSPDPAGIAFDDPVSFNPYPYARNAPTRYIDPLGRSTDSGSYPGTGFWGTTIEQQIEHFRRVRSQGGASARVATDYLRTLEAVLAEQGPGAPPVERAVLENRTARVPQFNPNDTQSGQARPSRPNPGARPQVQAQNPLGPRPTAPPVLRPNGPQPIRPVAPAAPDLTATNPNLQPVPPGRDPNPTLRMPRPQAGAGAPGIPNAPGGTPAAAPGVTPPATAPGTAAPGTPPAPAVAPPAAGGVREALNKNPGPVLNVLVGVTVLAQCYKNNTDPATCMAAVVTALGAAQLTQYVGRRLAFTAAGKVIATGVMGLGAGATVYFTALEVMEAFHELDRAAAGMETADRNAVGYIDQLTQRLRRVTEDRRLIQQEERTVVSGLLNLEREIERTRVELDTVEALIAGLSAGTTACEEAIRHQDTLRGVRSEAQRKQAELDTVLGQMRARAANCRTEADSLAIRTGWSRVQELNDEIAQLLKEGQETRARLLDAVARLQPAGMSNDVRRVRETLTTIIESIDHLFATLGADASLGRAQQARIDDHQKALDALKVDTAKAEAIHNNTTWAEDVVDFFRSARVDVAKHFKDLRDLIDLEQRSVGAAPIQSTSWDFEIRKDRAIRRLAELKKRAEDLEKKVGATTCDFSDDDSLDRLRRIAGDAQAGVEESNALLQATDRCPAAPYTPPAPPPPAAPIGPRFTPNPPSVLRATLECASSWIMSGSVLEIVSGGRPETCNIRVTGWNSKTTAPVEVLFSGFAPGSGLRAAPGDTEIGGDVMYAAGVNDRSGEYVFGQGFSTPRGAPTSVNPIVITVRQEGHGEVRLPLTINVVQDREPVGRTLTPPTPVVGGTAVPGKDIVYCVFQYRIFGDPPACWHFAAAACGTPRYTGRPEYQLVGTGMTQREADLRVHELSRYHVDGLGCRTAAASAPPVVPPPPPPLPVGPDPAVAPPPTPPVTDPEPVTPRPRIPGRFGLSPTGVRIKVGETVRIQAFGVYSDAPDMVIAMSDVAWSGDKPPTFTATAADKGKTFWIYATGPGGIKAQTTVTVDAGLPGPPSGTVPDIFSGTTTRPDTPVAPPAGPGGGDGRGGGGGGDSTPPPTLEPARPDQRFGVNDGVQYACVNGSPGGGLAGSFPTRGFGESTAVDVWIPFTVNSAGGEFRAAKLVISVKPIGQLVGTDAVALKGASGKTVWIYSGFGGLDESKWHTVEIGISDADVLAAIRQGGAIEGVYQDDSAVQAVQLCIAR